VQNFLRLTSFCSCAFLLKHNRIFLRVSSSWRRHASVQCEAALGAQASLRGLWLLRICCERHLALLGSLHTQHCIAVRQVSQFELSNTAHSQARQKAMQWRTGRRYKPDVRHILRNSLNQLLLFIFETGCREIAEAYEKDLVPFRYSVKSCALH
jgi:hypothetical protein